MGKATANALKARQRLGGSIDVETQDVSDGQNCRGIEHVVATGVALDLHRVLGTVLKADNKVALDTLDIRMHADDVVGLGKAIGKHAATRRLGELDQMRILAADDDGTVLAHQAHELGKGGFDLLDARVVIEMVGLDISHDDHVGVQEQEGAVGLVGLGDKIIARAVFAVGVIALDDAADQEAGVQAHAIEHGGAHRRRRGLAVRAGDGDGGIAVAQGREHLGAGPDGNTQLAGANKLGVRLGNSGRDHDHVGLDLVDRRSLVTNVNLHAGARKLANVARSLKVGTGNGIAALVQNEGDAAHAGATDTDEVGALKLGRGGCSLGISHVLVYSLRKHCL